MRRNVAPVAEKASIPTHSQRRNDIDALRVFATLALIVFHTARVFDEAPWHIKNDLQPMAMDVLVTFMNAWHMPLFFTLAGAAAAFSLRRRSASQFIDERISRLLIPFSFGILLVIPPQVYIERISDSPFRQSPIDFEGSYLQFFPQFFTQGIYPSGNFSWHHLWFIGYLFVFSLLLLPLFQHFLGKGREQIYRWGSFLSRGFNVALLAIPLIVIRTALAGAFPGPQNFVNDLANIAQSMLLMTYGFIMVQDHRIQEAIERNLVNAALCAAGSTAVISYMLLAGDWAEPYSGRYFIMMPVWAITTWSWLLVILSAGGRTLRGDRAWIRRFGEIAFPFYIVHQTVIVAVAYYVVEYPWNVAAKFSLIALVSLIASWLLAEGAKHSALTRFIFGIKQKHGNTGAVPTGASRPHS